MPTQEAAALPLPLDAPPRPAIGNYRWVICALLFFGTTINYIDRQVLSLLAPDIQRIYHINEINFGRIAAAFTLFYAFGQLGAGWMLDRVGNRIGYGLAVAAWSIASMTLAGARSALGFGVIRAILGVCESPNYPAATKTIAEWLPRRERALGMGVVNAGSNLGALLVPAVVPLIALTWGISSAFLLTGAVGFVFVALWFAVYRRPEEHPRLAEAELAHIRSDPEEPSAKVPWASLLNYPQAWAFILSKVITDSIWTFLIFFSAKFLFTRYGVKLDKVGLPMVMVYFLADVGSIGGGWISGRMIRRGWTVNAARKTTLLVCAFFVVPVALAPHAPNAWAASALIGLAMAAHQGFSANQYTLVSDMFPKRAVGSVAGIGGSAGYLGATVMSLFTGWMLQRSGGNYQVPFLIAGVSYLVAFSLIQLCAPRLTPAPIGDEPAFPLA